MADSAAGPEKGADAPYREADADLNVNKAARTVDA
jgi:hypothetical protein